MGEDEARRFNVLLEDIQTSVKVIAEGHGVVLQHLGRIEGKVDVLEGKVDVLEGKVDVLEGKVDVLDARLGHVETDVADIRVRLGRVEKHVGLNGTPPRRTARRKSSKK